MEPITLQTGEQLDPKVVKVVKAIKTLESGGSVNPYTAVGDKGQAHGAFQFNEKTGLGWKGYATKYLKNPTAPMTPANQNKAMYEWVKEQKDAGRQPEEIDALHNGARKDPTTGMYVHNDPQRAIKFRNALTALGTTITQPQAPQQATGPVNEAGTTFTSTPNESGIAAGAKFLGNIPSSAWNFAKGLISQVNPIETAKRIVTDIPEAAKALAEQNKANNVGFLENAKNMTSSIYENVVPKSAQELVKGNLPGVQKAIVEDPVGQFIAPAYMGVEGIKGLAKGADTLATKSAMNDYVKNISAETAGEIPKPITKYSDVVNKGLETVTEPVRMAKGLLEPVTRLPSEIAKSALGQFWSLDKQTMKSIIDNPTEFTKLKREASSRQSLASDFGDAIDTFTEAKKDTGAEYNPIRESQQPIVVPPEFFKQALDEFKLSVDKKGKVVADTKSITRNPADIASVQRFLDNWSKKKVLTPGEVLNMRSDIANDLSKFHMDKTTATTKIGDSIYAKINNQLASQVPGLRVLDEKMSPLIEQAKQIKKDFLKPDGEFKDNAISRIANATGKGKEALLTRMEEVMPGITKRIQVLKAVEDLERAGEFKVGAYNKLLYGGVSYGMGGPIGLILTEIIASPGAAVRILRAYGATKAMMKTVASNLKLLAGGSPETIAKIGTMTQGAEKSQYTGLLNQGKMPTNTPQ